MSVLPDREEMIIQYLPLVKYIAGRIQVKVPPHLDQEDLVSYGVIGLMDAVNKYDPGRGIKFETYASQRIRGSILDALRQNTWAPRSVMDKLRKINNAYRELEQSQDDVIREKDVAAKAGLPVEELNRVLAEVNELALESLEKFLTDGPDDQLRLVDAIEDLSSPNPEMELIEAELQKDLIFALQKLAEKDYLILSLYYYEQLTLKEIGKVLGITESRVSQLHSRALLRLRSELEDLR